MCTWLERQAQDDNSLLNRNLRAIKEDSVLQAVNSLVMVSYYLCSKSELMLEGEAGEAQEKYAVTIKIYIIDCQLSWNVPNNTHAASL